MALVPVQVEELPIHSVEQIHSGGKLVSGEVDDGVVEEGEEGWSDNTTLFDPC